MRCKIAAWQESNKSVRQTQSLFNMEFGINLVPTQRTIYVIHRKFMKTGSVVDAQDQEDQGADAQRKTFEIKKRYTH